MQEDFISGTPSNFFEKLFFAKKHCANFFLKENFQKFAILCKSSFHNQQSFFIQFDTS
jgi:hypothetical protein